MEECNTFTFFASWWEALKDYPDATLGSVLRACCQHVFDEEESSPEGEAKMAFSFIRPSLDTNIQYYTGAAEKRTAKAKKMAEARWSKVEETKQEQSNAASIKPMLGHAASIKNMLTNAASIKNMLTDANIIEVEIEIELIFFRACAGAQKEKKFFIFLISHLFLSKGLLEPSDSAEQFFKRNQAAGWVMPNGAKIKDPYAWAEGWKFESDNKCSQMEAHWFLLVADALNCTNVKLLDAFRGATLSEDQTVLTIRFKSKAAANKFADLEQDKYLPDLKRAVAEINPNIKTLNYQ